MESMIAPSEQLIGIARQVGADDSILRCDPEAERRVGRASQVLATIPWDDFMWAARH
jgi:hypothetical protein